MVLPFAQTPMSNEVQLLKGVSLEINEVLRLLPPP